MQTEYEFDVFISYSNHDKEWVRGELLKRIEQVGLKAFIDFRDSTRGAPSIKEMERGVLKSRKTLLILTPDYIQSEWCELEGLMGQTLSPANRDLRLIPLLKADCKKPLSIGSLTHIDFTEEADLNLAWRQLSTALSKPPEIVQPRMPERDAWSLLHPYPMSPHFTGRIAERDMLTGWLDADAAHPLLVLRALGGFGKSALAWHWITHDVDPTAWPHLVWWSFYEGDASFNNFLAETLHYLSGGKLQPDNLSAKDKIRTLLQMLHLPGTLLVLDGFERELRDFGDMDVAYQGDEPSRANDNGRDCISSIAEDFLHHLAVLPNLRSKVLLTTRLCPRVLEARGGEFLQGCHKEELRQMHPADAVMFFRAQGIRGTHTEVEQACAPYGYHPLSLRLLAGLIVGDFQQPGDIAVSKRLDVSDDLIQRKHHVLETAYDSLTPTRQALLGRIACFRSPVKYEALKALAIAVNSLTNEAHSEKGSVSRDVTVSPSTSAATTKDLDADLRDLLARGLLHHDAKEGRFDLHPIVRSYAYDRLAVPDRAAAHTLLRDYFAAVPTPYRVTRLDDLVPVIELYHHTVKARLFDEACKLFHERLNNATQYLLCTYQLRIDLLRALLPDGEVSPPCLQDVNYQAWTLNSLANSYSLIGQPRCAVPLFEQQIGIREKQGEKGKRCLASGLRNLAYMAQLPIGALRGAEANLRRSITLCQETRDNICEALGHQNLGLLLTYQGEYYKAKIELSASEDCWEEGDASDSPWWDHRPGLRRYEAHRVLWELLRLRHIDSCSDFKSEVASMQSAIAPAHRNMALANEAANNWHAFEREFVRAHWLLGSALRVAGQTDEAEIHLHEALERCLRINLVEHEANILIDLARLHAATGAPDKARRLAEEALIITERSGYVLQGADAHLEIAKLALTHSDKTSAIIHAKRAHLLATCDGPPDYTYKAAYDEAGTLLVELGVAGSSLKA